MSNLSKEEKLQIHKLQQMEYYIPKVVDKKYLMAVIETWDKKHPNQNAELDYETFRLRRVLSAYITEDMINDIARKYATIYINAVKQYMGKNGLKEVSDLMAFFNDRAYGNEFFPDFIAFIIQYVMDAVSIKNKPKLQFVKSGEKYAMYSKNSEDGIDETVAAYYDSDLNVIFLKDDKITDFNTFMNHLSHEISHAIDSLDATKGVFADKIIQKYCDIVYFAEEGEYKNNAEEKSARRIGVYIEKDFTNKLSKSWQQDKINMYNLQKTHIL